MVLRVQNANETIQLDDPEGNQLVFKGNTKVSHLGKKSWVDLTMSFQTKDVKFRVTITDFMYKDKSKNELSFNGAIMFKKKLIKNTTKKIHGLMNDLEDFIISENSEDDGW